MLDCRIIHTQLKHQFLASFGSEESLWNIVFEGKINGKISIKPKGSNGFGYDPIFIPQGYEKTFAEMTIKEKNTISHRKIALMKLESFLFN